MRTWITLHPYCSIMWPAYMYVGDSGVISGAHYNPLVHFDLACRSDARHSDNSVKRSDVAGHRFEWQLGKNKVI